MQNPTLKEMSKALGLSISTISRALKDHPDISKETKNRVKELAHTLDYEPNANAINLRTKSNKIFGIVLPSLVNFFYGSFVSAIEKLSMQKEYSVIIMQTNDDIGVEKEILKIYRQNRISGLFACLSPHTNNLDAYQKMKNLNIPVVFFDKVPEEENWVKVCIDDESAATTAAEIILAKKKKNILALFGNKNLSITKWRYKAFVETIKKNKHAQLETAFANNAVEAEKIVLAHLSKKQHPDTVFCMSDEILAGAMKAVQIKKIIYPDQLGIISMSDGLIPKFYYPEITYIETSGYKLGILAFEMMQSLITGDSLKNDKVYHHELKKGGSI